LQGDYDVILCLEVLQFALDPSKVLSKLELSLKNEGELILSLPNEFHILRRLKILFGKPDFGGFQAPHVRFFYPSEIRRLIHACGLRIEKIESVSIAPPSLRLLSKLGDILAGLFPGLFSLFMVVKAAKARND